VSSLAALEQHPSPNPLDPATKLFPKFKAKARDSPPSEIAVVGMDFLTVATVAFGLFWVLVVLHHERRRDVLGGGSLGAFGSGMLSGKPATSQ